MGCCGDSHRGLHGHGLPYAFVPCESTEDICSSRDCGFLRGEDSCSQDCSNWALDLLALPPLLVSTVFQPFIGVLCFQPSVDALLAALLFMPGFISRRQRTCVKGMGKDGKVKKALCCFWLGKTEAQASSLIRAEFFFFALGSAELEKRQEPFNIDIAWNDVRSAVVTECPECQFEAAAAVAAVPSQEPWQRQKRSSLGKASSFSSKRWWVLGQVVRGGLQEALGRVVGLGEHDDVYATMGGKWVELNSTLTPDCTVYLHTRLRGGSRENVAGQWTCTICNAQFCWPVHTRCYRCGEPRTDTPAPLNGKGRGKGEGGNKGPLGRDPLAAPGNAPPTVSEKEPRIDDQSGQAPPECHVCGRLLQV